MQSLIKNIIIAMLIGLMAILLDTYQTEIEGLFSYQINWQNIANGLRIYFLIFVLLKIIAGPLLSYTLSSYRSKYQLRKAIDIITLLALIGILIATIINSTASLIVSYGIVSAGIAIALQDTLKNLVGGITLQFKDIYKVGDRIETQGVTGDVIDIDLFYTTISESKHEDISDQNTGRNITIPNYSIVTDKLINYSQNGELLWDEFQIFLTFDSNWQKFIEECKGAIFDLTKDYIKFANENGIFVSHEYYVKDQDAKITNFISITDNWLEINFRYLVDLDDRRIINHRISLAVMRILKDNKDIKLAVRTQRVIMENN